MGRHLSATTLTFREWLKRLASRGCGVTSDELAEEAGYSRGTISNRIADDASAIGLHRVVVPDHMRTSGTARVRFFLDPDDAAAYAADCSQGPRDDKPAKLLFVEPAMLTAQRHFDVAALTRPPSGPVLREGALDYKQWQRRGGF